MSNNDQITYTATEKQQKLEEDPFAEMLRQQNERLGPFNPGDKLPIDGELDRDFQRPCK